MQPLRLDRPNHRILPAVLHGALLVACASPTSPSKTPASQAGVVAHADAEVAAEAGQPDVPDTSVTSEEPELEDAEEEEEELVEPEPQPPPPFPDGTVVLHVGSSSAGALGIELDKALEARGVKGYLKAEQSTFIPQWANGKMGLRELLWRYKPDLVIISLGGNETQIPDPTVRARTIQRLVKLVGDRPCVWVGTPRWKKLKHTGLLEVIEENAAPCRFVDTDLLAPNLETLRDGVHPTYPERRRWAKRMIQWLQYNRDPNGDKPWSLKADPIIPPDEIEPPEPAEDDERRASKTH
jgi:acyl-CoA thioesterase-1